MLVGETWMPSLASSPQMRRWPQPGFSRARPDQPCRTSAARPADAESRARGAAPTARNPSDASRDGYAEVRQAEPARRGRGRRRPCRRSSQPRRRRETTRILAPFKGGACAGGGVEGSDVDLRPCPRCGSTLTSAFRFCPGCGFAADGSGSALERRARRAPRARRRVRWRAISRSALLPLASVARSALRLPRRFSSFAPPFHRRLKARAGQIAVASGGATRLLLEMIVVSASSGRDCLRSMVLLRRLHARRAAVIYSTGCAVLSADAGCVEQARAELRLIDELIAAASSHTSVAFTDGGSAAAATEEAATEENVLTASTRVPA
jgi:hypothetical protein